MSREKKKFFIIASALTLGFGILTPFSTFASIDPTEYNIPVEQQIKGTVIEFWHDQMFVKGEDGNKYLVGLHTYSDEQIQSMNISPGTFVQIEGQTLDSSRDFYTFEVYKKSLPVGITEKEMKKLELLYNQTVELEKAEEWEAVGDLWLEIDEITQPYYLAAWEPVPFDMFISMYEYPFSNDDLITMEELYKQWISLSKSGAFEEASLKLEQFYTIVDAYYIPPTFDVYLSDLGITVSEIDYPIIKQSYDEAIETSSDYEIAGEKWSALEKLMRPYYQVAYPPITFDEHMSYYDFDVSEEDYVKLKEIYETIMNLEANDNFEETYEYWSDFNLIVEPYFKLEEGIPFRASQIVINGEAF